MFHWELKFHLLFLVFEEESLKNGQKRWLVFCSEENFEPRVPQRSGLYDLVIKFIEFIFCGFFFSR